MPEVTESLLAKIRALAKAALQQAGAPPSVTKALQEIASLAQAQRGDTPEPSDIPHTENQTL